MPQAAITPNIFWGNNPLPNGQGTMPWLNINDFSNWTVQDIQLDHPPRQMTTAQRAFRAAGVYLSDDFGPRSIHIVTRYTEANNPLGLAKAQFSQSGEQMLSFDNKVTAINARLNTFGTPKLLRKFSPLYYELTMEFFAITPWFFDIASTTSPNALSTPGSTGAGTTTNFNITYAGAVFAYPLVFTLNSPVSNTQSITKVTLQNTMSGESLVWNGSIGSGVNHNLVIDSGAFTVKLDGGHQDFTGSFPQIYGPAGQVNTYSITVVAAGATTGVALTGVYNNRWEL